MSRRSLGKESKTVTEIKRVEIKMIEDQSPSSAARSDEAKDIIATMIGLAHKMGRPRKYEREYDDVA